MRPDFHIKKNRVLHHLYQIFAHSYNFGEQLLDTSKQNMYDRGSTAAPTHQLDNLNGPTTQHSSSPTATQYSSSPATTPSLGTETPSPTHSRGPVTLSPGPCVGPEHSSLAPSLMSSDPPRSPASDHPLCGHAAPLLFRWPRDKWPN